ncbi:exodeoxyribonuclease V subunit alpha [Pokkaliibacter sp. CJK22405]|uniref:exodeoxyribonuclease V subunit alpha n=1 Tax=Pokkaliibacter sp. CJK22405 TaxID=3384615 RepID=UPI00398468EB
MSLFIQPDYAPPSARLLAILDAWVAAGWLRELDVALVRFLSEQHSPAPVVLFATVMASHQLGRGHVCLDLEAMLTAPDDTLGLPPEGRTLSDILLKGHEPKIAAVIDWNDAHSAQALLDFLGVNADSKAALYKALETCEWISSHEQAAEDTQPLVLTGQRLYLRRYWQYEQTVQQQVVARLADKPALEPSQLTRLHHLLDQLFPDTGCDTDWQKMACAMAAARPFTLITGGPGTGKTTTVVKLLVALQAMALESDGRALRIRLAAPTGKAAARLTESISGALTRLNASSLPDGVLDSLTSEASTLHRLLGSRPDSRHFIHHVGRRLGLDLLVVDEASMVDLEMMAALLAAMPDHGRLILLGDKDQLASVEAGAVLGELCRYAEQGRYTPETAQLLEQLTGQAIPTEYQSAEGDVLDQSVVMLRQSHRFHADSGIGQLAKAVNQSDTRTAARLWSKGFTDLSRWPVSAEEDSAFAALVIDGAPQGFPAQEQQPVGYRYYLQQLKALRPADSATQAEVDHWAQQVLAAHGSFQVLSTVRQGNWGVEGLNLRIAKVLQRRGLISGAINGTLSGANGKTSWYEGRPVMVVRNDYSLGLMNGDIGITFSVPDGQGGFSLKVAFPDTSAKSGTGEHAIRWVLPSRLNQVDTVFAMTVHKSQGSEFSHTALVLPDHLSQGLTRELIYTGITRAKRWFTLAPSGGDWVFTEAIKRRVLRASGLRSA